MPATFAPKEFKKIVKEQRVRENNVIAPNVLIFFELPKFLPQSTLDRAGRAPAKWHVHWGGFVDYGIRLEV